MFVGSTAADLKIGSNRVKAVRQGANLRYFRPDSLSGLEGWWDAADASTITLDGERVSAIADKSGNDRSLTNSTTGVTQPGYVEGAQAGRNVLRFTAANATFLQAASKADFDFLHKGVEDADVFIAGRFGDTADPDAVYYLISTGVLSAGVGFTVLYDDRSGVRRDSLSGVVRRGVSGTAAASVGASGDSGTAQGNEGNVGSFVFKPTLGTAAGRLAVYTNGRDEGGENTVTDSYSAATSSGFLTLGKAADTTSEELQGDIYEVVIYKGGLTTDQRQLVEGYLAHKWGLQSKLPYDHPYASSFYGVQTLPVDTDVLAFAAASGAVSIPDLLKIEALVDYLKAQSLWDYARFYPMKSAQNAGSGSTVYGLGGLTSNNMTLVNSPTWGSDGVTFNGSTQYGTTETSDLSAYGEILLLLRASPTNGSSPDVNAHIRCGIGNIQSTSPAATLTGYALGFTTASTSGETVSSFFTAAGEDAISKIIGSSGVTWTAGEDHIVGYQFGDATVFYKDKTGYTPNKNSGATPSTPLGPSDLGGDLSDFFVAGQQVNGSPTASQSPGVVSTYFVIVGEAALTTTQRETITDLINAL